MGFRGCSIAAGTDPATLAEALGLTLGEADDDMPEDAWIAQRTDGTWSVYFSLEDDFDVGLDHDSVLEALSRQADVLYCLPDEGTMTSLCCCWRQGELAWRVWHDGMTGSPAHLAVEGTPPPPFEEIRDRLMARQRQSDAEGGHVDYLFDVPLDLFEALAGFRYDIEPPASVFTTFYEVDS